jgi:hypothetical protein
MQARRRVTSTGRRGPGKGHTSSLVRGPRRGEATCARSMRVARRRTHLATALRDHPGNRVKRRRYPLSFSLLSGFATASEIVGGIRTGSRVAPLKCRTAASPVTRRRSRATERSSSGSSSSRLDADGDGPPPGEDGAHRRSGDPFRAPHRRPTTRQPAALDREAICGVNLRSRSAASNPTPIFDLWVDDVSFITR